MIDEDTSDNEEFTLSDREISEVRADKKYDEMKDDRLTGDPQ